MQIKPDLIEIHVKIFLETKLNIKLSLAGMAF